MQPQSLSRSAVSAKANPVLRLCSVLLAIAFALELVNLFSPFAFSDLLEMALILFVVVCTLADLTRQLPLQNVLLAAFGVALIGGAASMIGAQTGIPFGPVNYAIQPKLFKMPWVMPLIWVAIVLNTRGVARLILRPWRKTKVYGFWVIGITAALVTLFDFALETFAHLKHFWLWTATNVPVAWQGAPLSNFFSWFAVTVLILAFVTPPLINKQLSKHRAPDFYPLWIWLGAILIFAIAPAISKLWLAVGIDAVIGIVTTIFAFRGARW